MWLALDTVDEENGCLRYVSGAHKAFHSSARADRDIRFLARELPTTAMPTMPGRCLSRQSRET